MRKGRTPNRRRKKNCWENEHEHEHELGERCDSVVNVHIIRLKCGKRLLYALAIIIYIYILIAYTFTAAAEADVATPKLKTNETPKHEREFNIYKYVQAKPRTR